MNRTAAQWIRPKARYAASREEAVAGFGIGKPAAHVVPEQESIVAAVFGTTKREGR
jgi:hypothetical protein